MIDFQAKPECMHLVEKQEHTAGDIGVLDSKEKKSFYSLKFLSLKLL